MSTCANLSEARSLMLDFADRTGLLTPRSAPRRYLWTDAFAVCNFFDLYRQTSESKFRDIAVHLIAQVHETLGRHRADDRRRGWISGLPEKEGLAHPTAGGLRIGKALPERQAGEPYDEVREWDRDGQYFHYLTKWMHALGRAAGVTGDPGFGRMACELAQKTHSRFIYSPTSGSPKRLCWKMSIDLSRPAVASSGQHDPLDGLITFYELQGDQSGCDLKAGIDELRMMCRGRTWATDDPLGLGGLLADAYRAAQLSLRGAFPEPGVLNDILSSAVAGLESLFREDPLSLPARHRLAFREFGLSIGMHAADRLKWLIDGNRASFPAELSRMTEDVLNFGHISRDIENFWRAQQNQSADTWVAHLDINEVMLATSLSPGEFLAC